MISLNSVIISGRVTQEPEIREVGQAKKKKLAKFGIAHNKEYATASGQKKETMFIDIQAWENQANYIEKFVHKGDSCIVEGNLVMEQWRTKLGEMKSKIAVRALKVQRDYIKSREKEDGGNQSQDFNGDAPPNNEHRYTKDDCIDPSKEYSAKPEQPPADDQMYDDSVVPF